MKRFLFTLWACLFMAMAYSSSLDRQQISLNFGWKFHLGDIATIPTPENANNVTNDWRIVDLPHDFQIEQPWVAPGADEQGDNSDQASNFKSRLSARGFKEMGIGWYVKTLTPPAEWKGKRVVIDFQGIMYVGDVYLNGKRVGGTDYGYVGFDLDLSKQLVYGSQNVIAVKANTQDPLNSRWYTGGGLIRDVGLTVTSSNLYFPRHPIYVTTPKVSKADATVSVQTEIACYLKTDHLKVHATIEDANHQIVADDITDIAWNGKSRQYEYRLNDIHISSPQLWSCESPYLYRLKLDLCDADGNVADHVETAFGVRTIEFSPDFGFKLNGKKVILKGIANHHSLGALGSAAYPKAIDKRLKMLR